MGDETVPGLAKYLLTVEIDWKKTAPTHWESTVGGRRCLLVMNDFPDEPLFTVSIEGESLDLDDAPTLWHIGSF